MNYALRMRRSQTNGDTEDQEVGSLERLARTVYVRRFPSANLPAAWEAHNRDHSLHKRATRAGKSKELG